MRRQWSAPYRFIVTAAMDDNVRLCIGESDGQSDHVTRVSKTARLLLAITGLTTMSALATYAVGLDRQALWQVVQPASPISS
jgi:hypothetical protein